MPDLRTIPGSPNYETPAQSADRAWRRAAELLIERDELAAEARQLREIVRNLEANRCWWCRMWGRLMGGVGC